MDRFEKFASILVLDNRRIFAPNGRLEEHERMIFGPIFDGVTENTVLIPKKNGKTTMIGALALFALFSVPDCEIVCAAASRDQATLLFNAARGFVARTPGLKDHFDVLKGFREIRPVSGIGRLRVIAADSATADGWLGDIAIADELGRWKSQELWSILRAGVGPRDGQILTISTAADDQLSPLGILRTRAYELPVRIDDHEHRYTFRSSGDGAVAYHEWALTDEDDRDDMRIVKLANPASWHTIEELQKLHDSPGTPPWFWARLHCGVWLQGEDTAIEPHEWDCLGPPKRDYPGIPDGAPIWLGIDLAWKQDATAIVPLWMKSQTERVFGKPVILTPPGDGSMLDDRLITEAILGFNVRFKLKGVVFDPNAGGQQLAQQLERHPFNIPFIEHSQKPAARAVSDIRFMEALRRKELIHDGDKVFRQHVLNVIARPTSGGGFFFDRPNHGPRKATDAIVAASMVHHVALEDFEAQPSTLYGFS
jgi:phage terminase large subunit-like protein